MLKVDRRPLKDIRVKPDVQVIRAEGARQVLIERGGEFYTSYVSMPWMLAAITLGARAAKVGMLLWWLVGVRGHVLEGISVRADHREKCGISRFNYSKGLSRLEQAGLVKVEREAGKASKISLILS
jgi:DNA-binding transcriptional ArsR family regulator